VALSTNERARRGARCEEDGLTQATLERVLPDDGEDDEEDNKGGKGNGQRTCSAHFAERR
jgi:hypothetical protein